MPSPFQQRDVPPEGVLAQFEYFSEGNGVCDFDAAGEPAVQLESKAIRAPSDQRFGEAHWVGQRVGEAWVGQPATICFGGFDDDGVIDVEIVRPDGTVEARRLEGKFDFLEGFGHTGS